MTTAIWRNLLMEVIMIIYLVYERDRQVPATGILTDSTRTPFHPDAMTDKPNTVTDVPLTSLHDVETIPVRDFLTREVLFSNIVYSVIFEEQREHTCCHGLNGALRNLEDRLTPAHVGAKHRSAKRPREVVLNQTLSTDDQLLIKLKEQWLLSWRKIAEHFPGRSKGSLQVRYSTKLKNRGSGSVARGLDLKNSSSEATRAPCQSLQRQVDAGAFS